MLTHLKGDCKRMKAWERIPMWSNEYFFITPADIGNAISRMRVDPELQKNTELRNLKRYYEIMNSSLSDIGHSKEVKQKPLLNILVKDPEFWNFHLRYPGFRELAYQSMGIDRTLIMYPKDKPLSLT